jgi:hypothetical protein
MSALRVVGPVVALIAAVGGWFPLVLSAARAMANRSDQAIATPLAIAGAAALTGILVGAVAFRQVSSTPLRVIAGCAIGLSVPLALVALVFAVSFHWQTRVSRPPLKPLAIVSALASARV